MAGKAMAGATACVFACLLLSACSEAPPPPPPPKPVPATVAGEKVEGLVTVTGDDSVAARLTWQRPAVTLDPDDLPAVRRRAADALAEDRLYENADAALPLLLALLARDPADTQAKALLDRALAKLRADGDAALADAGDDPEALRRAEAVAAVMRNVGTDETPEGVAYLERVDVAERLWELNENGEAALAAGKLGMEGDEALALFRQALTLAPGQPRASQGVAAVESAMLRRAEDAATRMDFDEAERWLALAKTVRPEMDTADASRAIVEDIRRIHIARLRDEGLALLAEPHVPGHLEGARERLAALLRIARPGDAAAAELRTRIDLAAHYGLMRPGQRFTDALQGGGRGPEMVVVPHGGFRMGARASEPDATDAERPQRYVRFERGFGIARTEVTVGQFRRFVEASGYRPRAVRRGHSLVYDDRGGNFVRTRWSTTTAAATSCAAAAWTGASTTAAGPPPTTCRWCTSARRTPRPMRAGCRTGAGSATGCRARRSSSTRCAAASRGATRGAICRRRRAPATSPAVATTRRTAAAGAMPSPATATAGGGRPRWRASARTPSASTISKATSASGWPTAGTRAIAAPRPRARPGSIPAAAPG